MHSVYYSSPKFLFLSIKVFSFPCCIGKFTCDLLWLQIPKCNSLLILNKPIFAGEITVSLFVSGHQGHNLPIPPIKHHIARGCPLGGMLCSNRLLPILYSFPIISSEYCFLLTICTSYLSLVSPSLPQVLFTL